MIGLGHALSHSLAPQGVGGFVGALDALIAQGATVTRAYSVRQVRAGYAGPCGRLRGNGMGSPEAAIPYTAGALDKSAASALIASGGGTAAYWTTLYDQSTNASHATQGTTANQVNYGTGIFTTGALGDQNSAQTNCWMNFNPGTLNAPFAVWVVCSFAATSANRNLVGTSISNTLGIFETAINRNVFQNWGASHSTGYAPGGKVNLLSVCNGAASKLYVGGILRATGNAGTAVTASTWRIGAAQTPTLYNWFGAANHTIAEVIIFGNDPTGLAGWANFVTKAKTYFGTA